MRVGVPPGFRRPETGGFRSRVTAVGGIETGVPDLVVASAAAPAASADRVTSGHLQRWPRNRIFDARLPAANICGH